MDIAVLGIGDMGQLHLNMYQQLPNVKIGYIFARDENKLKKIANKYKTKYTTNPQVIYQDKSINGVDICLPTNFHHQYVMDCISNKKQVMVETPIAFSVIEANEMIKLAKTNSTRLLVASLMPFVNVIKYIVEYAKSSQLGLIHSIHAYRYHPPYQVIDQVKELMSFELDTVIRILGMTKNITARKLSNNHINVILNYSSTTAHIEMKVEQSQDYILKHGVKIKGQKGEIEARVIFSSNGPPESMVILNGKPISNIGNNNPYQAECKYFVDMLNSKNDGNYLDANHAYNSLLIADQINKIIC